MSYYVYMLLSTNKSKIKTYVGYTIDLKRRLIKHNSNKGAKSTKGRKWIVIYKKKYSLKSLAMSKEYFLKKNYTLRKKIREKYLNVRISKN
tara:strand:- start:1134 stop:1406 length:273 start_codon:yes stop_codon:yes gene_type:complete